MKKIIFYTILPLMAITIVFYSCRKKDVIATTDVDLLTDAMQNSSDQFRFDADNESFANDALNKIENSPSGFITLGVGDTLRNCDVTIDRSNWSTAAKTIVITYKDTSCNTGPIRSGKITLQLIAGQRWFSAGAVLKYTFTNLKVVPVVGGKNYIYNGVRYVTNVNGGLIFGFAAAAPARDTIVHVVRATDTVTFEDGTTRTWWVARKNTYVKNILSFATLTSNGDTTVNGSLCTIGGTTRLNKSFVVQSPQAIVSKSLCGWYKMMSGVRKVVTDNQTITTTFGVNQNGVQQQLGLGCGDYYGYKVEWTKLNGTPGSAIVAY